MMYRNIARTLLVATTVACSLLSCMQKSPALSPELGPAPELVYHEAWQHVNDDFVDRTFNHKDWSSLEHSHDGKLLTLEDAHKAITEDLALLNDKFTRFLDSQATADEMESIKGKIVGIGIYISQGKEKDAPVEITSTIEDSPAAKCGLCKGDSIISIDGRSVTGKSTEEISKLIRGQAGTTVKLTLNRKGVIKKFTIKRDEIKIKAVSSAMLEGNIGYIKFTTFIDSSGAEDLRKAISSMPAKAFILDLRNNPGGLLTNALEIANGLIPGAGKTIVTEINNEGRRNETTDGNKNWTDKPMVVLINEESASASEILSGALKDNGRAVIHGTKSYGKACIQEIQKLQDHTCVHVTIANYLTPNGTDINGIGVEPNIKVEAHKDSKVDEQKEAAIKYLLDHRVEITAKTAKN